MDAIPISEAAPRPSATATIVEAELPAVFDGKVLLDVETLRVNGESILFMRTNLAMQQHLVIITSSLGPQGYSAVQVCKVILRDPRHNK
jgi:hypothetical protein